MPVSQQGLDSRLAVEALRAGVPNRAAIRQMGTEQTTIEHAFEAALEAAWGDGTPGIGIAGGFGAGKSHLLGYLAEVALQQNFVVSRVVISKETPLSHPAHVMAAALRNAVLPDRPEEAIAACVAVLRSRPDAVDALAAAIGVPDAGVAAIFAACLFLVRRSATTPEMLRRIVRFLSGARVSLPAFREALSAAGAKRMFVLKGLPAAEQAHQLARFLPLLFRAAGYGGWCLLLDEVELIGRYTPLQRALSYAWLAAWTGLDRPPLFPGIVTAYAITDDFVTAVISARQDSDLLPERLKLKGRPAQAEAALAGIRHVEQTVQRHRLLPPNTGDLAVCHQKVRGLYSAAYGWEAPDLPPPERTSSRTMRQYIKGWITQWDLLRLEGRSVALVEGEVASNYGEDAAFETTHGEAEEGE